MANSIIIFSDFIDESSKIGGFKIVNSKNVQKYLKIISLLEEEGIEISNGELNLTYNSENFDYLKLTSSDVKCLEKIFDIEINGMESDSYRILS